MNIHEYQAKQFLREYGIPVLDGRIIYKAEEAKTAAGELDGPLWVVKAQIHAGGRGKGKFIEESAGTQGGVRLASSASDAAEDAVVLFVKITFPSSVYPVIPLAALAQPSNFAF